MATEPELIDGNPTFGADHLTIIVLMLMVFRSTKNDALKSTTLHRNLTTWLFGYP